MNSRDIWFGIIVLIIMFFILILAIANIFFFNETRTGKTLSHTTSIVMMAMNALLLLLALILFIWAIVKVVEIASERRVTDCGCEAVVKPCVRAAPCARPCVRTDPCDPVVKPCVRTVPYEVPSERYVTREVEMVPAGSTTLYSKKVSVET